MLMVFLWIMKNEKNSFFRKIYDNYLENEYHLQ